MTDIGLTGGVADAAGGGGNEPSTQESAFQFMQNNQQQAETQNEGNPAWKPFLDVIPTQLHSQVRPVLEQWDRGVQDRFTQQAEQYAPWKPFIDQGISPDTINGLINLLENDPKALWENLGQYHGFTAEQAQQAGQGNGQEFNLDEIQDPEGQQFDINQNPEYQQMKLQVQQMQQAFEGRIEQEQNQQMQQQLTQEIEEVKAKNPNIQEPILLALAHTFGMTIPEAASRYDEIAQSMLQGVQRPSSPTVLSPTGGVPSAQQIKPSEMSRAEKRNLVAQILEQSHAQNT